MIQQKRKDENSLPMLSKPTSLTLPAAESFLSLKYIFKSNSLEREILSKLPPSGTGANKSFKNFLTIQFEHRKSKPHKIVPNSPRHTSERASKLPKPTALLKSSPLQPSFQVDNNSEKLRQGRDSRSILRKNSLFLMCSLKTRYSCKKQAQMGLPYSTHHMDIGLYTERAGRDSYSNRFEYMEQARRQMLKEVGKKKPIAFRASSPFNPEPW